MPSPGAVKFVYVPADPHEPLQQWEAAWSDEQGELECVLNKIKARLLLRGRWLGLRAAVYGEDGLGALCKAGDAEDETMRRANLFFRQNTNAPGDLF